MLELFALKENPECKDGWFRRGETKEKGERDVAKREWFRLWICRFGCL